MDECAAPADVDCRIITPAFVQAFTFCTLMSRAVIAPSAGSWTSANLNASAVPQMSAPDPTIVNVPLFASALPAAPTEPMSAVVHPLGSDDGGGGGGEPSSPSPAAGSFVLSLSAVPGGVEK